MKQEYMIKLEFHIWVWADSREEAKEEAAERTPSKGDLTSVEVAY